jgi:hypothetical protein
MANFSSKSVPPCESLDGDENLRTARLFERLVRRLTVIIIE